MTAASPWPDALAGTPAVAVIEQAIARHRLSHSLLLHGDDHDTLVSVALAIADRLLNAPPAPAQFAPEQHPDCFVLRPTGKMRQISADATRDLIGKVQVSPAVAPRKVAILHEVDRMNTAAANVFLKTLEEPPANTTLLLLTTRPYALLPTIRSRVLHFRFAAVATAVAADGWAAWLEDYRAWLGRLAGGVSGKGAAAEQIFTLYGLVARFSAVLDAGTEEVWSGRRKNCRPTWPMTSRLPSRRASQMDSAPGSSPRSRPRRATFHCRAWRPATRRPAAPIPPPSRSSSTTSDCCA